MRRWVVVSVCLWSAVALAAAEPGKTPMVCTPKFISKGAIAFLSAADVKLFCPTDGRAGFVIPSQSTKFQSAQIKYVTKDGEEKTLAVRAGEKIGSIPAASRLAELYERFGREGKRDLTAEEIRGFGLDPNTVGNVTLYLTEITLDSATPLYVGTSGQDKRTLVQRHPSPATQEQCLYVANMKIIAGRKNIACSVPSLCSATVECLDSRVGWVTRNVVCASADGKSCPESAEACLKEQEGLSVKTASIETHRQPQQRQRQEVAK